MSLFSSSPPLRAIYLLYFLFLTPNVSFTQAQSNSLSNSLNVIPGLQNFVESIPGASNVEGLSSLADPNNGLLIPGLANDQTSSAINSLVQPIGNFFTSSGGLKASDIQGLLEAIPKLVEAVPVKNNADDFKSISPELMLHVLNGGQIPGVPSSTLDGYVKSYLKRMVATAERALQGDKNASAALPKLSELPNELIQRVLNGETLPGLTPTEQATLKQYYLSPAASLTTTLGPDAINETAYNNDGDSDAVLDLGLTAAELLNRLPKDFDVSALPQKIIDQVSRGEPVDLLLLEPALLKSFIDYNPDLADAINDALDKVKDQPSTVHSQSTTTVMPVFYEYEGPIYEAIDIEVQYELLDDGSLSDETLMSIFLYALIGVGSLMLITIITVVVFCLRNWTRREKAEADLTLYLEQRKAWSRPQGALSSLSGFDSYTLQGTRLFQNNNNAQRSMLSDNGQVQPLAYVSRWSQVYPQASSTPVVYVHERPPSFEHSQSVHRPQAQTPPPEYSTHDRHSSVRVPRQVLNMRPVVSTPSRAMPTPNAPTQPSTVGVSMQRDRDATSVSDTVGVVSMSASHF